MVKKRRRNRSITMTFLKGFENEFEYVSELKSKGINRSHWICLAVKEKIEKDKEKRERVQKLERELKEIKSRISNIERNLQEKTSNIVYIDKKTKEENEIDIDLAGAASRFFGLSD